MAQQIWAAVASGDRLTGLTALRDRLAAEIDACGSARDVAVLAARLVDVLEQIAVIKPPENSKVDEVASKRAERRRKVGGAGRSAAEDSALPEG